MHFYKSVFSLNLNVLYNFQDNIAIEQTFIYCIFDINNHLKTKTRLRVQYRMKDSSKSWRFSDDAYLFNKNFIHSYTAVAYTVADLKCCQNIIVKLFFQPPTFSSQTRT
jgi:hypothetical protein